MFGCLKKKFGCLQGFSVTMRSSIPSITACAVLWNFLLAEGEARIDEEIAEELDEGTGYEEVEGLVQTDALTASATNSLISAKRERADCKHNCESIRINLFPYLIHLLFCRSYSVRCDCRCTQLLLEPVDLQADQF